MNPARLLLTPIEAAEVMGLSRSKFYELLAADEIESIRIDRARRIPIDALEDYVDRKRQEERHAKGTV